MKKKRNLSAGTLLSLTILAVALISMAGCSKGVSHDPSIDPNNQSLTTTTSPAPPAKPSTSTRTPGGDPIDMTELDAKVQVAEKNAKDAPADEPARVALAHAYLARANALTKARQYRSALGDYRRTLKYDAGNKEAANMSATIISILQEMNIPVPPEGQEPPPKPMTANSQGQEDGAKKSY